MTCVIATALGAELFARSKLSALASQTRAEIARRQARPARRPALLGVDPALREDPALGDATESYRGLILALAGGDRSFASPAWRDALPPMPPDIRAVLAEVGRGPELEHELGLRIAYDPLSASLHPEPPREALAHFARFRPALRYARRGARAASCDWDFRWEEGFAAPVPNLILLRAAAELLAYEASQQPPTEALETGLAIVALGDDLARVPVMIHALTGTALRQEGFRSLAHTFGRPGLSAADYQRVFEALAADPNPDLAEVIGGEGLLIEVGFLRACGQDTGAPLAPDPELVPRLALDQVRALEGLRVMTLLAQGRTALPLGQRLAALSELSAAVERGEYGQLAALATPDYVLLARHLYQSATFRQATRALAAAHLTRLETGAFPADLAPLSAACGDPLLDAYAEPPAPLRCEVGPAALTLRNAAAEHEAMGLTTATPR